MPERWVTTARFREQLWPENPPEVGGSGWGGDAGVVPSPPPGSAALGVPPSTRTPPSRDAVPGGCSWHPRCPPFLRLIFFFPVVGGKFRRKNEGGKWFHPSWRISPQHEGEIPLPSTARFLPVTGAVLQPRLGAAGLGVPVVAVGAQDRAGHRHRRGFGAHR